jgi:hypothetical protein
MIYPDIEKLVFRSSLHKGIQEASLLFQLLFPAMHQALPVCFKLMETQRIVRVWERDIHMPRIG